MPSFSTTKFFKELNNKYFNTKSKKIEFFSCIMFIIIVMFLQRTTSTYTKAFMAQMQGFVALYLAFRFGILGMSISIIATLKDTAIIILVYTKDPTQLSYIVGLTTSISIIIWVLVVGIISIKQEKHRMEMQRLAITDDLTNVFNQRFFHSTLESEIVTCSKNNVSIGLILIDIDNFMMYNDLYGHQFGDTILKNTAAILKSIVNAKGNVYRYGGDEFAILVKNLDVKSLEQFAKLLHRDYKTARKEYYSDNLVNKITFSIGLSQYPNISNSAEELISHANTALYQTKNMGDDKINFYQDIMLQINQNVKSDQQMIGVFRGLLSTINTKDKYTFGHCERVSSYVVMIGEAMGLDLNEIQTLLYAGLLHDIGKIELPKSVLNKTDRLTDEEFDLIRQHPIHSANILAPLSSMNNLIDYVKHHHERFDGKGYPDGLKGEDISLGARILCVADCFDAMVSDRPYRKSMTVEDAFKELEKCSCSQFDSKIVHIFISAMRNNMSIKYNYNVENEAPLEKQLELV